MTYGADTPYGTRRRVDPVRIWAGGAATALVAAGIALVGVLVIRALSRLPGLHQVGEYGLQIDQVSLAILAAAAAILATALLHLLMVSTPRAYRFFSWIMGLFIVALIVQELVGTGNGLITSALLSALYLIIGIAITSLLAGVGRTAIKYVPVEPRQRPAQPSVQPDARYDRTDQGYPEDEPTQQFRP